MYLDFFKFKKSPFNITPDPEFLFLSPSHREASAAIFYAIENRKGFVAVTGEVGAGKTTILRSYLEGTDPERIRIVYVFNAVISFDKLLKHIVSELGIAVVDEAPSELVNSLFLHLIDEYKNDRNVVLIIDEAQNMPVETLERLRMLSNLETSKDKLLQIILVGQPEFENKLNLPELRQLKQRIAVRCRIEALKPAESFAYIQHRLMKASQFYNPVFTKGALKLVVKEANGIPRIINVLCDNALITGFGYQRNPVDGKIIKEVIKDFQGERHRASLNRRIAWVSMLVFLGLVGFASRSIVRQENVPSVTTQVLTTQVPSAAPELVKQTEQAAPAAAEEGLAADQAQSAPEAGPAPAASGSPAGDEVATATPPEPQNPSPPPQDLPQRNPRQALGKGRWFNTYFARDRIPQIGSEDSIATAQPSVQTQAENPPSDRLPEKTLPAHVVKRGDSVGKLLMDTYGRVDKELLKTFQDANPQITNIDKIKTGEEIVLPKLQNN